MTSIEQYRDLMKQLAALAGGTSIHDEQRFVTGAIARAAGQPHFKLDARKPSFFQCLDPASPNYGKRIFIAGFDPVGSTEFLFGEDCSG